MPEVRVVLVSPSFAERSALTELLGHAGHDVTATVDCAAGRAAARDHDPDAVIVDAACESLARELAGGRALCIVLAARAAPRLTELGMRCLTKPIDMTALCELLAAAPPAADAMVRAS